MKSQSYICRILEFTQKSFVLPFLFYERYVFLLNPELRQNVLLCHEVFTLLANDVTDRRERKIVKFVITVKPNLMMEHISVQFISC
jgi:hypothetical protein